MTWQDVPGFFDFGDIYDRAVLEAQSGDTLVEVGTFLGKSAAYMAERVRISGKGLRFWCVDKWDPVRYKTWWLSNYKPVPPVPAELAGMPLYEAFEMYRDMTCSNLQVLRKPSVEAAGIFPDGSLFFVFIDAEHRHPDIENDIEAWLPKVRSGGILAGHDYRTPEWPDVTEAVDKAFGARVEYCGSSWIVRA